LSHRRARGWRKPCGALMRSAIASRVFVGEGAMPGCPRHPCDQGSSVAVKFSSHLSLRTRVFWRGSRRKPRGGACPPQLLSVITPETLLWASYMVCEFIKGSSLASIIDRGAAAPARACDLLAVLSALDEAPQPRHRAPGSQADHIMS
jgi:hypothetical protein